MRLFDYNLANKIHNNYYCYSSVKYINCDTKIVITCPLHGDFLQTPYKHINRKQGCPKCRGINISKSKRNTKEEFIIKATKIHGTKYNYNNVDYINMHTSVNIVCLNHGLFSQTPNNHIFSKNGCPKCGYNVSNAETQWLDSLSVPIEFRQKILTINGKRFKVDAYDKNTKTVYEFFGYFWHGHPNFFNPNDINPRNKISFGKLYEKTLEKIEYIKSHGFNLIYIWG